jgi:hypothetical protein
MTCSLRLEQDSLNNVGIIHENPDPPPSYNESQNYFNSQYRRFSTFFKCKMPLKYSIHDYIKSGFYFHEPHYLICYNCKSVFNLYINRDPCLLHQRIPVSCEYKNKIAHHQSNKFPECLLSMLLLLVIMIFCGMIVCIHKIMICKKLSKPN